VVVEAEFNGTKKTTLRSEREKGIVCSKKEKREQKFIKKILTRAGIVRDIAYEPSAPLYSALKLDGSWTENLR